MLWLLKATKSDSETLRDEYILEPRSFHITQNDNTSNTHRSVCMPSTGLWALVFVCVNPHPRICLLILEREGGREVGKERERKTERETLMWERNTDQLLPTRAPARDRICNLGMCPDQDRGCNILVYGTTLQPPEPPGLARASLVFLIIASYLWDKYYLRNEETEAQRN